MKDKMEIKNIIKSAAGKKEVLFILDRLFTDKLRIRNNAINTKVCFDRYFSLSLLPNEISVWEFENSLKIPNEIGQKLISLNQKNSPALALKLHHRYKDYQIKERNEFLELIEGLIKLYESLPLSSQEDLLEGINSNNLRGLIIDLNNNSTIEISEKSKLFEQLLLKERDSYVGVSLLTSLDVIYITKQNQTEMVSRWEYYRDLQLEYLKRTVKKENYIEVINIMQKIRSFIRQSGDKGFIPNDVRWFYDNVLLANKEYFKNNLDSILNHIKTTSTINKIGQDKEFGRAMINSIFYDVSNLNIFNSPETNDNIKAIIDYYSNDERSDNEKVNIRETTNKEYSEQQLQDIQNDLNEFLVILRMVNKELGFENDSNSNKPNSEILSNLSQQGIFSPEWVSDKKVIKVIDGFNDVVRDKANVNYMKDIFDNAKINIINEINKLLEIFSVNKIKKHFANYGEGLSIKGIDIVLEHPIYNDAPILFEIKYLRSKKYEPNKESIFQLNDYLKEIDGKLGNKKSHIVLLIFSDVQPTDYESLKFNFTELLERVIENGISFSERIHLIPMNPRNLESVGRQIANLYNKLNLVEFNHVFKSDRAIERNDEILNQYFIAVQKTFDIMITPIKCDFWRFGFILSNDQKLIIDEKAIRHTENKENMDIHICVGSRYDKEWKNKEALYLQKYPSEQNSTPFTDHLYIGDQVRYWIQIDLKEIRIEVFIGQRSIGRVQYPSSSKKYIHFAAWCDGRAYHLETSFKISSFKSGAGLLV